MRTKVFRIIAFILGSLFVLDGFFVTLVGEPTGSNSIGAVITSLGFGAIFLFYAISGYSNFYKYLKDKSAK